MLVFAVRLESPFLQALMAATWAFAIMVLPFWLAYNLHNRPLNQQIVMNIMSALSGWSQAVCACCCLAVVRILAWCLVTKSTNAQVGSWVSEGGVVSLCMRTKELHLPLYQGLQAWQPLCTNVPSL